MDFATKRRLVRRNRRSQIPQSRNLLPRRHVDSLALHAPAHRGSRPAANSHRRHARSLLCPAETRRFRQVPAGRPMDPRHHSAKGLPARRNLRAGAAPPANHRPLAVERRRRHAHAAARPNLDRSRNPSEISAASCTAETRSRSLRAPRGHFLATSRIALPPVLRDLSLARRRPVPADWHPGTRPHAFHRFPRPPGPGRNLQSRRNRPRRAAVRRPRPSPLPPLTTSPTANSSPCSRRNVFTTTGIPPARIPA